MNLSLLIYFYCLIGIMGINMLLLKLSEMRILLLCTFLLEVSEFKTFCIWLTVHLVMVGVNVSI